MVCCDGGPPACLPMIPRGDRRCQISRWTEVRVQSRGVTALSAVTAAHSISSRQISVVFRHNEDHARRDRPDPGRRRERACEHCGSWSQLNFGQERVSCSVQERRAMMPRVSLGVNREQFAILPSFLCLPLRGAGDAAQGARHTAGVRTARRAPAGPRPEGFGKHRSVAGGTSARPASGGP
jgi:hypothetical protein